MILQHYIDFLDGNGFVEVQPPQEWKKLSVNLSFETDQEKLSAQSFSWVGDNAEGINSFIEGGLLTGSGFRVGIFEGLPYEVRFTCNNVQYTLLSACLNSAVETASFSCDVVEMPVRETGKIDYLNELADSFRYEYLFSLPTGSPGKIDYSDFIDIWYLEGKYPQKFEIMMTALSLFIILKEIYETTKRISDVAAEAFSVPTGGITSAFQLLYLLIYLISLIVALIDLLNRLIDLVFPFVYYHRAMYVRTLIQKGCDHLGLAFSSSIFAFGGRGYYEYIMPEKNQEGVKVGYPTTETGFFSGTLGDLLAGFKEKYNAEIRVIGNTLYFEHEDFFINMATYNIPGVYNKPNNANGYNAYEVPANYVISYSYDSADLYSLTNRAGTQFTAKIEPNVIINKKNVLIKNLEERNIPYTLPVVKTTISTVEIAMTQIFNGITGLINAMSSIFNPSAPAIPAIPLGGQIDVLLLDTHLTAIPKIGLSIGNGKTLQTSVQALSAETMWTLFHASKSAFGVPPFQPNQWIIYKDVQIPMCCEEYLAIKDNNYCKYQGNDAKIINIDWVPYDQVATITFWVRKPYTNNLKLTTIDAENNSTVYT